MRDVIFGSISLDAPLSRFRLRLNKKRGQQLGHGKETPFRSPSCRPRFS